MRSAMCLSSGLNSPAPTSRSSTHWSDADSSGRYAGGGPEDATMAGRTPIQVFEDNITDADRLLHLTRVLLNTRTRQMRTELRDRVGEAMRVPRKKRADLDCVESDDVFLVLKPEGPARREHFAEPQLRPLLRQAVVAIAAAVESYITEKACCFIGDALRSPNRKLLEVPVTVEQLSLIHI